MMNLLLHGVAIVLSIVAATSYATKATIGVKNNIDVNAKMELILFTLAIILNSIADIYY